MKKGCLGYDAVVDSQNRARDKVVLSVTLLDS